MVKTTLNQNQIKNLLRQTTPVNAIPRWPSFNDRKLLHEAATHKRDKVTLTDGRVFLCQYAIHDSIAWGKHEAVYVKPANGDTVPCGWFRIKSLLAEV